jgi:hypothetical protein
MGQNYLRAILDGLQTPIAQLSIFTDYSIALLEILSPFIGAPIVVLVLFWARWKRR